LGGLSFKYNDGKWSCATNENSNTLTNFYLSIIDKHSEKFINFCKKYFKRNDFSLPTDIDEQLIKQWKKSENISDTDNDTQFITEKIPIDEFGYLISKFY
jgi:hypothetical protein